MSGQMGRAPPADRRARGVMSYLVPDRGTRRGGPDTPRAPRPASGEGNVGLDEGGFAFARQEADRIGADGDPRRVAELAVVEAEGPEVQGADDAPLLDPAAGQRAAGVGADVVEHARLAFVQEDGEVKAVDLDVPAFPFFQLVQITEGGPGHTGSRHQSV